MKKSFRIVLAVLAIVSISAACSKEIDISNPIDDNARETLSTEGKITIKANLPDALTRVSFTQDTNEGGNPILKLAWEENDKLLVADHADPTNTEKQAIFDLDASCVGSTEGVFTGTPATEGPYDVSVVHGNNVTTTQTQPADGDASGLEYVASAVDVSDLSAIEFQSVSSVLALQAKLPNGIASTVNSVTFKSNAAIFSSGNTLTVSLTTAGVQSGDDILDIFATLAPGDVEIPVGTVLIVEFGTTAPKYITRYHKFTAAAAFKSGKYNSLKLKCVNLTSTASDCVLDGNGTDGHAYEIGDKYQLMAVQDLASTTSKTYFKMIADVDMTGMTDYVPINEGTSGYSKVVDFNGNHKKISNLNKHLFYVLKGSVYDLTLDKSDISTRGILAEYVQGTGHTITNVTVTNGKVNYSSDTVGGLIGKINNGSGICVTITNCKVSNTEVKGAGSVGGLLGSVEAKVVVSDCSYSGNTVTGTTTKIGGLVGVTVDNLGSSFTNCRVEAATVDASSIAGDARAGGFIGQHGEGNFVYGCTVGDDNNMVEVKAGKSDPDNPNNNKKVVNTGGFVGVNYGIITKDSEDNHSNAYVKVTSTNTTGNPLNLGGFAGFQRGIIAYSDAVVSMDDLQGQYIGGFCGYIVFQSGKTVLTDNCTVYGNIRGNNYTGGFVGVAESGAFTISNCQVLEGTVVVGQSTAGGFAGQIKSGTVENCSAIVALKCRGGNDGGFVGALTGGTVTGCSSSGALSQIENSNTVFGGFAGYVNGADVRKCSSTVDVSVARSYVGGLIGQLQTANTVSECFYNGTISGPANTKGGLIGTVSDVAATITNCYTSGELIGSSGTQIYGGIVGELKAGASVTNCYSTMDMTHGGRAMGGIVGRACNGGWNVSTETGNTVSRCIAWNPAITYDGTPSTSASSGAIIGYTSFKNILNNCFRRPDMAYLNSNTAVGTTCQTSMVDQVDSDGTNWAVNGSRPAGTTPAGTSADAQYQAPYYGVAAASSSTVSSIAQALGWDSTIWDFSGPLPLLK